MMNKLVTRGGLVLTAGPEGIGHYRWEINIPYVYGLLKVGETIHVHDFDCGFVTVWAVEHTQEYEEQYERELYERKLYRDEGLDEGLYDKLGKGELGGGVVRLKMTHILSMCSGVIVWKEGDRDCTVHLLERG